MSRRLRVLVETIGAAGLAVALVATYWVVVPIVARQDASAGELPSGGLVATAPDVGWPEARPSVSEDGAAQYTVPLWVPKGRGVQPDLALSYDSRSGNGLVGVGWTLTGLESVTRCPRTYAQDGYVEGVRFDTSDAFCLNGNRLRPLSTDTAAQREYRTEG